MAVLVALTVGGVGVAVGVALADNQREAAQQQMQRRATLVSETVTNETRRYLDVVTILAANIGSYQNLSNAKFQQDTAPFAAMGLPGATAVTYLVPVEHRDVPAVQRTWRARGATDLTLQPVGAGPHIFSVMMRSLDGVTTPRYGIDATQAAVPRETLEKARRTGRVTVSDPYQLLIDRSTPPAQRQMSFAIAAPVYALPDAHGKRAFRGWALLSLRGRDFISATLSRASQGLLDVRLTAPAGPNAHLEVAKQTAAVTGRRDLTVNTDVIVGDDRWRLEIRGVAATMPGGVTTMPTVVGAATVLLGLLLAILVYVLATGRARAQLGVRRATAELAAAEARARQQADLLSAIMDSIGDGVGVVDRDGHFLLHNPAAKAILGLDVDHDGADSWQEHYGMFLPDGETAFPVDNMPLVRALHGESTEQVEMKIRNGGHPEGITISVSGRPLRSGGELAGGVAVFHDITARKAAERQLAASAEALRTAHDAIAAQKDYLHQVIDALQITVMTCDVNARIVHANQAGTDRLGGEVEAGTPIVEVLARLRLTNTDGSPITDEQVPLIRAIAGETIEGYEAMLVAPDGGRRSILINARPLRDSTGSVIGAVGSSYDITTLREHETELAAFASVAAHDLKAPLTAVAGYAEIIDQELARGATAETLQPALARIRTGVHRMSRLIDDLLAYATARDARIELVPIDLQQLVAEVITERTGHLRGRTTSEAAPFPDIYTGPLPTVCADRALTRQLLDNLIGNAIKYTPPGQAARIDISAVPAGDPGWVRIVIADRGIGVPAADQPYIFDTFHRAAAHTGQYAGTGLGLAICKRIIDRHGGTIAVSDNPGGGTRVDLTLPAAASDTAGRDRRTVATREKQSRR